MAVDERHLLLAHLKVDVPDHTSPRHQSRGTMPEHYRRCAPGFRYDLMVKTTIWNNTHIKLDVINKIKGAFSIRSVAIN